MRHVSRTHRVALDWLFDRMNLDPKIEIRYIDTKHQLADILTKKISHVMSGTILLICSIAAFSAPLAAPRISALISCCTMAKRIQERTEEERVVSKSRPAAMNLSSSIATSSTTASSPFASKSPGMPIASGKPDSRVSINPNSFDASVDSSSATQGCILWRVNGKAAGKTPRFKKKKIQKTPTIQRLRSGTTKGNLLPKTVKFGSNPLHTEPVLQLIRKVKRIQKRHGNIISKYRHTHPIMWKSSSPWSRKSMEDNLPIL